MTSSLHLERLRATAGSTSHRLFAIAGYRDAASVSASHVHLFSATKVRHLAAVDVPCGVASLAFLGDALLVVGGDDGQLYALDAGSDTPAVRTSVEGPGGAITSVASDRSGQSLVVCTQTGHVGVYRLEVDSGTPRLAAVGSRSLSTRPLRAAGFDPNAPRVVVGGDDGFVRIVALPALATAEVREFQTGEGGIGALAVTDDGRVVVGCGDGSLRICYLDGAPDEDNRSGDAAHERGICGLFLTPAGQDEHGQEVPRRVISLGQDGVLKSWPLDSRRKPKTVAVGDQPTALGWVAPSSRAKPEVGGGQLVVVHETRAAEVFTLNVGYALAEDAVSIDGALTELREKLASRRKVTVRRQAVTAIGELPEDDAREMLEDVVANDSAAEVRALAATALGQPHRRRARLRLRAALDDDAAAVRKAALKALEQIEASPLAPVQAALRSRHADMRIEALTQLPGLRNASPIVPGLIAKSLQDQQPNVRDAALAAVWDGYDAGALEPAQIAFERGPADIRMSTLLRLGRARLTPETYALVEAALDDEDPRVRNIAFIVALLSRPALAHRIAALEPEFRPSLEPLEKAGPLMPPAPASDTVTDDDYEPLFAALVSRAPDSALRGALGLTRLADPRATGALLQLSREPAPEIRQGVVHGLRSAAWMMPGDDRAVARLRWLLDDPEFAVRLEALEALTALAEPRGDTGALETAAVALRSIHADIRGRALPIVVKFGPTSARANFEIADALLRQALDDEAENVRRDAFRTLWAWHTQEPQVVLEQAATSRHADIRKRVADELDAIKAQPAWVDALLLQLVPDSAAEVGLAAYNALTASQKNKARAKANASRAEIYLVALSSPRPEVRVAGCQGAKQATADEMRVRLIELLTDEAPGVAEAAIEALDHLVPTDQHAFLLAYESRMWNLRVRAAELNGHRRDERAIAPMRALLSIPVGDINRPSDKLRQRAARAMADVGSVDAMPIYVALLDDDDGIVREMGARGLAGAVRAGREQPLLDALSHADLPVRSWVAEGLARVGDARAMPVLVGTLGHDHKPIRLGAILSCVALGAEGVQGILQGLEDRDREIQDLVFAVVVARDLALAREGLPPDLLTAALSAASPEIRYAAARALEVRTQTDAMSPVGRELVGPRLPERASMLEKWPSEAERDALLNVLVSVLASADPARRYAAARVLSLRPQPEAFWREAKRLRGPVKLDRPDAPATNWSEEMPQRRERGWIRRLFDRVESAVDEQSLTARVIEIVRYAGGPSPRPVPPRRSELGDDDTVSLVFGTYVGLVRQGPRPGESDETHRVRRDSLGRLGELAQHPAIGRGRVLPLLRRALSDPHHLVRKAALAALRDQYAEGDVTPLAMAIEAQAADVGRTALDELVDLAIEGHEEARALALRSVNAPSKDVRAQAVTMIQPLFEAGSLEPWLIALQSRHADVRLAVVDRLVTAQDARVDEALRRALESDHEDLRLRAALALATRGDGRAIDVLAAFLRSETKRVARDGLVALVELAHRSGSDATQIAVVGALAARLEDDPDHTADRAGIIDGLGRVQHPEAGPSLLALLEDDDATIRGQALAALLMIARHPTEGVRRLADGRTRARYRDDLVVSYLEVAAVNADPAVRLAAIAALRDVDAAAAQALLAGLLADRDPLVRVQAAEALAFRAEVLEDAGIDALREALREGRRELVLPAAVGVATQQRPEALQSLLLVLRAGEQPERERALLALGTLGDARALPEIEPFLDLDLELAEEDEALAPVAIEALGRLLAHLPAGDDRDRVRELVERMAREGSGEMRPRALTGLRYAGDDRSRGLLEAIVADPYEQVGIRTHAADQLGRLTHEGSADALATTLRHHDRALRWAGAQALERLFPTQPTQTHLLRLQSPYSDLAGPSAAFLARHGDPATLVPRLAEIGDPKVRRQLRRGLVRRGSFPVTEIGALLQSESSGPLADAGWLAGASGETALAQPALASAHRAQTRWREGFRGVAGPPSTEAMAHRAYAWQACLWAARRLGDDPSQHASLLQLGRDALDGDAPPEVVEEAVRLIGQVGGVDDVARLEPALTHAHGAVRRAAALALVKLDAGRAAEILAHQTASDAVTLVPLTAMALERGQGDALLASDRSRPAVLTAVLTTGHLDEVVARAQASGDDPARLSAIETLGRMGGASAETTIQALVDDKQGPEAVRKAAFRSLRRLQRARERAARLEALA